MPEVIDPFDFDDPGSVPDIAITRREMIEVIHAFQTGDKMATKPLANVTQPLPFNAGRPRLSEYALNGKYTPLAQLEGRELSIESTELIDTKYGEALKMNLTDDTGTVHQV